ncbi:hypothetical protein EIN_418520 [Entamoeba invadens IP1]|uniref:Calponin-homology (CH) domain-containing protein n=1 Tax=Entamoeba invadens IP1 TaxID=370355 RepID=A0A0A1U1Q7_ENTIV|nr:hypothetical protein EIN_418520 [Entamoeba invadens IP1]ELP87973.1 hypothetical protein EIN_418520 [Entamoeba invadens IP1]|eukprot:XP_004254744.1 hypothetical protein EIN_418520 [Entamoeba invadens IP1]
MDSVSCVLPDRLTKQPLLTQPNTPNDDSKRSISKWINIQLSRDYLLTEKYKYLPISLEGNDLFNALSDGVLLYHLVLKFYPEYPINFQPKYVQTSLFYKDENLTKLFAFLKRIIPTITLSPTNFSQTTTSTLTIVLGFLWQFIDKVFEKSLKRAIGSLNLSPNDYLIQWVNQTLKADGSNTKIFDFENSIMDSKAYIELLHHFISKTNIEVLRQSDLTLRAEEVVRSAATVNGTSFITVKDIITGNKTSNSRFVGDLFNIFTHPFISSEEETQKVTDHTLEKELDGIKDKETPNKVNLQQEIDKKKDELVTVQKEKKCKDIIDAVTKEHSNLDKEEKELADKEDMLQEMNDVLLQAKAKDIKEERENQKRLDDIKHETRGAELALKHSEEEAQHKQTITQNLIINKESEVASIERLQNYTNEEVQQMTLEVVQQNEELKKNIESLEKEKGETRKQVFQMEIHTEELSNQLKDENLRFERKRRELERQQEMAKESVKRKEALVSDVSKKIEEVTKATDLLISDVNEQKSDIVTKTDILIDEQDTNKQIRKDIKKGTTQNEKMLSEIVDLQTQDKTNIKNLNQAKIETNKVNKQIKITNAEKQLVIQERQQVESDAEAVLEKTEEVSQRVEEIDKNQLDAEIKYAQLEDKLVEEEKQRNAQLALLTAKLSGDRARQEKQGKREIDKITKEARRLKRDEKELSTKKQLLEEQLRVNESLKKDTESTLKDCEERIRMLNERKDQHEQSEKEFEVTMSKLQAQKKEINDKLTAINAERTKQKKELKKLETVKEIQKTLKEDKIEEKNISADLLEKERLRTERRKKERAERDAAIEKVTRRSKEKSQAATQETPQDISESQNPTILALKEKQRKRDEERKRREVERAKK